MQTTASKIKTIPVSSKRIQTLKQILAGTIGMGIQSWSDWVGENFFVDKALLAQLESLLGEPQETLVFFLSEHQLEALFLFLASQPTIRKVVSTEQELFEELSLFGPQELLYKTEVDFETEKRVYLCGQEGEIEVIVHVQRTLCVAGLDQEIVFGESFVEPSVAHWHYAIGSYNYTSFTINFAD